jgi:hypothetical protein
MAQTLVGCIWDLLAGVMSEPFSIDAVAATGQPHILRQPPAQDAASADAYINPWLANGPGRIGERL